MKFDALTHKPVNVRGGQDTYINALRKRPNCPSWILCKVYQHNLGSKISEIYFFSFINPKICCGYSRDPSKEDDFLSTKTCIHMLILIDQTIITF